MAEIIGIVASGISIGTLAVQIVGSFQHILDLHSTIKDAPENIQSLLKEIELLGNVLSEIEDEETQPTQTQTSSTRQAVCTTTKYYQEAADCISHVKRDIAGYFPSKSSRRRYWIAVKTVMKEKELIKCLMRLERAKSLLNLALQCYTQ